MTGKQGAILVVDDEEAKRGILQQKLSNKGYLCQEAGNIDETLDKMRSNPAALVVQDIRMPEESGVELLLEIRASYPGLGEYYATRQNISCDQ